MLVRIRRLKSTIRLLTGEHAEHHHQPSGFARPQMQFAQAPGQGATESDAAPSQMASDQRESTGAARPLSAGRADPKKVADRVFELMKEEVRLNAMRGGTP